MEYSNIALAGELIADTFKIIFTVYGAVALLWCYRSFSKYNAMVSVSARPMARRKKSKF